VSNVSKKNLGGKLVKRNFMRQMGVKHFLV